MPKMINVNPLREEAGSRTGVRYDLKARVAWVDMQYAGIPCFSQQLLDDLGDTQQRLDDMAHSANPPRYVILHSSSYSDAFGVGGDLEFFIDCVETQNRAALATYANTCVDVLMHNEQAAFTSIALVQGDCMGGAFETALSCNMIVAEKGSKFGFPEIIFGMFPGMGALHFLSRRINPGQARRLLVDARNYTAEELYDLGVIDILAEPGEGTRTCERFIAQNHTRENGLMGINRLVQSLAPITRDSLNRSVRDWLDVAFSLNERNRKLMRMLIRGQEKRWVDRPRASRKLLSAS